MHDLTQRQVEILKSLIEEYINTAEAVGSETLEKKYNLSASPATIRNEMVRLTELNYLKKPHTSAGRIPTSEGMKFYVQQLMREKELSVAEEVAVKEKVWDSRDNIQRCLREVTKTLADKTKTLAVASTDDGELIISGYSYILDAPEFYDINTTKILLEAIDEYSYFRTIFSQFLGDAEVHVLLGADLGERLKGPYGVVFTGFETPMRLKGDIGIIGPSRLNFPSVVPMVRYFGELIEEIAKGW